MSSLSEDTKQFSTSFSPVTSPAPQVKQHGAGNLTGHLRKVKDLAADFHNLVLKWDSLKSQGMAVITEMANIMMSKMFNSEINGLSSAPKRIPSELESMCDSLTEIVDSMDTVVHKMQQKATLSSGLVALKNFDRSKPTTQVLFSTMTLEDVDKNVRALENDYRRELMLKKEISKVIVHAEDRDSVMFYLASWMHEPFLHEENPDLLKALLKDTGHIK